MKTYSITIDKIRTNQKADYILVKESGSIVFYNKVAGNFLDSVIAVYPSSTIVKEIN